MTEESWDEIYSNNGAMWYPTEGIIRFISRFVKRKVGVNKYQIKKDVKKILDVGCGNGNHIELLSQMGFESYGIDFSTEAIKNAKENLKTKNLKAELKVNNSTKLPFNDNFFELVISHGVLDHMIFDEAKNSMNEIKRVTKPGGYIYLTLISNEDCDFKKGKLIEKNTFEIKDGYEDGLIQHYFDKSEIKSLFEGLKVFDVEMYDMRFPSDFTEDKAYLQSSTNKKKYFDLSNFPDLNLKYSRWYIAAEKP